MVNPIAPHVVSGKLLSPEKTPEEALTTLRTYFDELAKHQEFIAMAWSKQYDTRRDLEWIRDPVNARMRSAMSQVFVMVMLVEDNLQVIESHFKPTPSTSTEVRHA
ncbi:hypothetical protein PZA22_04965 [Pectobacterium polaris]|uniref:hypothetical protein n=1 Tax=Pectobacterium polaris TaxID=2042057 RepID=UPI000EA3C5AA|nr:hypothetical protein [Pectobacterium polaris]MDE8753860.1 hypothetical protein [Pectobacterium polaris]RJL20063.1 hypothetical protein D5074_16990 [Pectobacterium polaris]